MRRFITYLVLFTCIARFVWTTSERRNPKLFVFSVGQGEAVLYRDTSGNTLLFDGGPDDSILAELGRIFLPWERHINLVVLSHAHADHVRGLIAVIDHYSVDTFWESGARYDGYEIGVLRERVARRHITRIIVSLGSTSSFGSATLSVLFPLNSMDGVPVRDAHDATVVLRIGVAGMRILLTGDLNESHEAALLARCASCLASDILQVPHHGSVSGLSPPFLAAVHPRVAFICVGIGNSFHHPRPEILARLKSAGVPYLRTDRDGGFEFNLTSSGFDYRTSGSAPR